MKLKRLPLLFGLIVAPVNEINGQDCNSQEIICPNYQNNVLILEKKVTLDATAKLELIHPILVEEYNRRELNIEVKEKLSLGVANYNLTTKTIELPTKEGSKYIFHEVGHHIWSALSKEERLKFVKIIDQFYLSFDLNDVGYSNYLKKTDQFCSSLHEIEEHAKNLNQFIKEDIQLSKELDLIINNQICSEGSLYQSILSIRETSNNYLDHYESINLGYELIASDEELYLAGYDSPLWQSFSKWSRFKHSDLNFFRSYESFYLNSGVHDAFAEEKFAYLVNSLYEPYFNEGIEPHELRRFRLNGDLISFLENLDYKGEKIFQNEVEIYRIKLEQYENNKLDDTSSDFQ